MLLNATNVRFRSIVKDATLSIDENEFVIITGHSGSGKTTLLTLLGLLLTPTAGEIKLFGKPVLRSEQLELRRKHFGFIFQTFNLFPTLSARDNVSLGMAVKGSSGNPNHYLSMVGLASRASAFPAQLSTGECQRVAIARALSSSPRIIFADEPTSSLDAANGKEVVELIKTTSKTVVMVTHDDRVLHYADRIITMEDGVLR